MTNKSITPFETIILMTIGLVLMIASVFGVIIPSAAVAPFMVLLIGITGLVTFWLPIIISSLES